MFVEILRRYEAFLRIHEGMRPWDIMRARASYALAWILAGLQVINLFGMTHSYGRWTTDHTTSAVVIIVFLLSATLLRWVKFPPLFVVLFGGTSILGLIFATRVSGIHSALIPFIVTAPMMTAFVGGWRSAVVFGAAGLAVLTMMLSVTVNDPQLASTFGNPELANEWLVTRAQQRYMQGVYAVILATSIAALLSYGGQQALTRFETAWKRAEESAQAKSDFLAVMSHELRTPMNGVLGLTDAVLSKGPGPLTDRQSELLHNVKGSGEHLLALLNDLLDLSKIEAGKISLDPHPFDLHRLVGAVRETFVETATAKGVAFETMIESDVPACVDGDDQRLRQVLNNLVGNAVKFTDEGSVRISVERDGEAVIFTIADTGPGIPADMRNLIFQPFEQGGPGTSRRFGGTGLGLTICKQLCTLMGGDVELVSSRPGGTVFRVAIPLREVPAQEAAAKCTALASGGFDGLRVLVAEDHPVNRMVIGEFLRAWGADCVFAEDGEMALEHVEAADFDLLLVDRQMPKLGGEGVLRAIRSRNDAKAVLPIIAVTADAMESDRTDMLARGVDGFVAKPLKPAALQREMQRVLQGRDGASLDARCDAAG